MKDVHNQDIYETRPYDFLLIYNVKREVNKKYSSVLFTFLDFQIMDRYWTQGTLAVYLKLRLGY